MQPIEKAPLDRQILLYLPEFDTHGPSWWVGSWSFVYSRWSVKTPYSISNKSVFRMDIPEPISWAELPEVEQT